MSAPLNHGNQGKMPRWSKYWLVVLVVLSVSSRVSTCPVGCTCTEYLVDLNVACSGNGSTSLPNKLPPDTTFLTLTGYRLPVLNLNVLGGLKKLRGLKLPSNEITQIEGTLEVFPRLYELDLSKNKLTSVSPRTFGNAAERLGYVDLSENPFDCDSKCGGLLSNSLCDCSLNSFNCTCNILWLKEQVKQSPSAWIGVRCQVPKDKDIRTVDIQDNLCKFKWRYLLSIIVACILLIIVGLVTIVYKCKKRSRYVLLGSDLVTEQQLNILAGKLGNEWENLAISHLGMKKADVDRFNRNSERDMRGQAFNMLLSWRKKKGKRATVAELVKQLKSFGLDLEKYQFLEESSDTISSQIS